MPNLGMLLLLLVSVSSAGAQSRVVAPTPRPAAEEARIRAACDRAEQVTVTHPARPVPDQALRDLSLCGNGRKAAAIASAVRDLRTSSDTALLRRYWSVAAPFDDRRLFEAAVEIGGDPGAAVPARVYALLMLVRMTRPGTLPEYSDLVGGWVEEAGLRSVRGGCANTIASHQFRETVTPLPSDWKQIVAHLRARLVADDSAPLDVRTTAWCIAARSTQSR